jgi:cell division protein FtsB
MQDKIKYYKQWVFAFVHRLGDVRFLGQVIFGVLVLLVSWSGVKAIQTNYNLQKQISALQQQNTVQQLANNNQKLQNQYYDTNQYLELSARQNFSLANPGEKEILVPKNVALAHTVNIPTTQQTIAGAPKQAAYQQHIQAWLDFFLHRQGNTD